MSYADVGFVGLPFVERISKVDALMKRNVGDAHGPTERHVGIVRHAELQFYLPQRTNACLIHTSLSTTSRSSAWCIHLVIMLLSGIWLFEFSYTLRVGFLAKMHGNGRMRVYKNSTRSSLTCPY